MPHSEGMAEQPQVKILDKALRVLMLFTPEQPEWGVSALSREVGMSKSTIHRILRVLEQHAFVTQNADTRRFRLGLAGIELGRRAQAGMELRRVALPIMEQLSATSGETVLLQVVSHEGDHVVCIERVQQGRGLRLILDVGSTAPSVCGLLVESSPRLSRPGHHRHRPQTPPASAGVTYHDGPGTDPCAAR